MNPGASDIIAKIRALEIELEEELARRKAEFNFRILGRKVKFENAIKQQHKRLKVGVLRYLVEAKPLSVLTAPVIYSLIVPFVLLDLAVSLYQAICFRAYGIPRVRRKDYLVFDRSHLAYLNVIEKINCAYCSYGNGVIAYAREIAGRTEQYWCPIKHASRVESPHGNYGQFVDFGDAEAYLKDLKQIRKALEKDVSVSQAPDSFR